MNSRAPAILDHLASLADTTRSRMLLLLDRHELTVSELCGIMQLPQSTVSRHLKALADSGWIAARTEGTSHLYTMTRDELHPAARRLWLLVREQVGPSPAAAHDQRRLHAALAERRTKRLQGFGNIDLRRGELEALTIDDARVDAATLMLVLHHVPEPERALAEVARVLKPGGRAVIVDMLPHDRESYRQQMGHVWLGFSDEHMQRLLNSSGFEDARIVSLAPDAKAKGPGLFVATGMKPRKHEDTKPD